MSNIMFDALVGAQLLPDSQTNVRILDSVARDLERDARKLAGKARHNRGAVRNSCAKAAADHKRAAQVARAKVAEATYKARWA